MSKLQLWLPTPICVFFVSTPAIDHIHKSQQNIKFVFSTILSDWQPLAQDAKSLDGALCMCCNPCTNSHCQKRPQRAFTTTDSDFLPLLQESLESDKQPSFGVLEFSLDSLSCFKSPRAAL